MTTEAARTISWRDRLPVVVVVVACVTGVTAAVTGAANPVSAVQFLLPGHWVYNEALRQVFHVDGATGNVDAQGHVPGNPGDLVVQGDTSGYVIGDKQYTEFDTSSLSVEESTDAAVTDETPVSVETAGGPYLVYRQAGKIVRLGEPARVFTVGAPVVDPVATNDGTVWVASSKAGKLCRLPADARTLSCPVPMSRDHTGALTLVDDRPMFVDTTADKIFSVEKDGLGGGRALDLDAPDDARVASTDVAGRVAILVDDTIHLVDPGLDANRAPAKKKEIPLPEGGEYLGPVSTGSVVAVVDLKTDTLRTYDSEGNKRGEKVLPPEDDDPRLTRGEDDRVYVDGTEGQHVLVVDTDGEVTEVPIRDEGGDPDVAAPGDTTEPLNPPQAGGPQSNQPPLDREPRSEQPGTEQPRTEQPGGQTPTPPRTDPPPPPRTDPPPPPRTEPPPPPEVPATPPGAPTNVTATAGDGTATVNWGPAQDNRSPITGYTVTWPGGSQTYPPGAGPAVLNGLANGTTYVFTVTATNGIGTGPGASSNPVTPAAPLPQVTPADAPGNFVASYDVDDRPTRDVVLTWDEPALGGGVLLHYVVSATGHGEQTVAGRTVTYPQLSADTAVTFTVYAVTQAPDGRTLNGAARTAAMDAAPPSGNPLVVVSRGEPTEEYCGEYDACAWMHVELTGFPPNTDVHLEPVSTQEGYGNEGYTTVTDADGNGSTERFAYAGVGHTVYIVATWSGGSVQSEPIVWGAG